MTPAPLALVDMDNTIVAFAEVMKRRLDALRHPSEAPYELDADMGDEPDYMQARKHLIKSQPGFWRELPMLRAGYQVLQLIKMAGFDTHILTQGPSRLPLAWGEKLEWCQDVFGPVAVTVTRNKSISYGRVLFDDWPPYFEAWLKHRPRGHVLCVAQPWNKDYAVGAAKEHPRILRCEASARVFGSPEKMFPRHIVGPSLDDEAAVEGFLERAKHAT